MFAPSLIPDVTFLDDGPEQHLGLLQRMIHGLRHHRCISSICLQCDYMVLVQREMNSVLPSFIIRWFALNHFCCSETQHCSFTDDEEKQWWSWLQTTQPTSGGAVTADSSCCANGVEPPRPQQWGPDLPGFFGMPAMQTRWMTGAAAHKSGWCRDQSRSDNFKQESLDLWYLPYFLGRQQQWWSYSKEV